jgi:hypothetical protein
LQLLQPSEEGLPQASFQPVWTIWPKLGPLDFELLVVDDEDAIAQVDTFYKAFADDAILRGSRRSHVTIAPRAGWQGYGPLSKRRK